MEEKKTIFDYLGQIFMMFGFMMGIMMIFVFVWRGRQGKLRYVCFGGRRA